MSRLATVAAVLAAFWTGWRAQREFVIRALADAAKSRPVAAAAFRDLVKKGNTLTYTPAVRPSIGDDNAAVGRYAAESLTTGSRNLFLGPEAGRKETTCDDTFILTDTDGREVCRGVLAWGEAMVPRDALKALGRIFSDPEIQRFVVKLDDDKCANCGEPGHPGHHWMPGVGYVCFHSPDRTEDAPLPAGVDEDG